MRNKTRNKKYNKLKIHRHAGIGVKYFCLNSHLNDDGYPIIATNDRDYKDRCAKSFPRKWKFTIFTSMKDSDQRSYEDSMTFTINEESFLVDCMQSVEDEIEKLEGSVNPNHLVDSGWVAESIN